MASFLAAVVGALGLGAEAQAPAPSHAQELRQQLRHERLVHRLELRRLRRTLLTRPSVQEALTLASVAYGVPRWQLVAVAGCESHQRADAYNRSSGASGLLQFLPSTFAATPFGRAGLSIWSPYANAMAAAWKVSAEGGFGAWTCQP